MVEENIIDFQKKVIKCWTCGKIGHLARHCYEVVCFRYEKKAYIKVNYTMKQKRIEMLKLVMKKRYIMCNCWEMTHEHKCKVNQNLAVNQR